MKIFGNKDKAKEVEERTELERKFEEAGQKIGRTTGKAAQKGANAVHKVVSNLEESGTLNKVRDAGDKLSDITVDAVSKVEGAIKDVFVSVSKKDKEKDE